MFKPNESVSCCPICGAALTIDPIDQFDLPVGYSAQCLHCCKYSDIWVNGLREVQCGDWTTPAYQSNYANNKEDRKEERRILLKLNFRLFIERIKHKKEKSCLAKSQTVSEQVSF